MKSILIILFFILSGWVQTMAGESQNVIPEEETSKEVAVSGGLKLDAIFMNLIHKGNGKSVSIPKPGLSLGGFVSIQFTENIGIQPEVNLTHKAASFGWDDRKGMLRSMGIEVPIYVMVGWDVFDDDRLQFGIAPFTEFGYYADWSIDGRTIDLLQMNGEADPMVRESQSGFAAMLGYEFGCGLSIHINYKICITDMLQPNISQGVRLYPQTAGIGIAYRFNSNGK